MILQILMVMDIVLQSKETKTTLASKLFFGLAKTMPQAFFLTAIYFFLPKTERNFTNHLHDSKEKHIFAT